MLELVSLSLGDGVRACSADPPPGAPPSHPSGVPALDDVGVTTPDLDRTLHALAGVGPDLRGVRDGGAARSTTAEPPRG